MTDAENKTEAKSISVEEHNKVLERARNFEAKVVDYEKRFNGVDPDRYKALNEEVSILRKETAAGDPKKIDQLIAKERQELEQSLEKRYSSKLTETEAKLLQKESELRKLMVIKPAMLTAAKYFNDDQLSLLEPVIAGALDLEGDEIIVKGSDGKAMPSVKDPRVSKMPIDEFFESLVSKYPSSAKPNSLPGGKLPGSKVASGTFGRTYTLQQLSSMPDHGKAILNQMDPKDVKNLFSKH